MRRSSSSPKGLAARVIKEAPPDNKERIRYAFNLALGRAPRPDEEERLELLLNRRLDEYKTQALARDGADLQGREVRAGGNPLNPLSTEAGGDAACRSAAGSSLDERGARAAEPG